MKASTSLLELENRATAALRALLGQVSTVKIQDLQPAAPARNRTPGIVARVQVLGHSRTLACEIKTDTRPQRLAAALRALRDRAARLGADATPVLIAPHLSECAQLLCKQNNAGFLDLDGNARLALGEVFIGRRALTCRGTPRAAPLRSPALPA